MKARPGTPDPGPGEQLIYDFHREDRSVRARILEGGIFIILTFPDPDGSTIVIASFCPGFKAI